METKHLVPFDFSDSSEIPHAMTARNYYAKVIRKYPSYEDFRQDMAAKGQPMGPQQTPLPKKTADISFQSASASFRSSTSAQPTVPPVPLQSTQQDVVEMADAGADNNDDSDSDQESIAKSMSNSTNDVAYKAIAEQTPRAATTTLSLRPSHETGRKSSATATAAAPLTSVKQESCPAQARGIAETASLLMASRKTDLARWRGSLQQRTKNYRQR